MKESKKLSIFAKYKGHCAYCGKELTLSAMTADHRVPKSKGGGNSNENLMPCCKECNHAKGDDNLEILRIHLCYPTLHPSDLTSFDAIRKAAKKYKFYYETYQGKTKG